MDALILGLWLLAAVLISSVIDQLVPKISLPLIQIGIGLFIALFASRSISVELDPELFLVLFIAPILYDEAKNADKKSLYANIKPILSLAIGCVFLTTLIVGFCLHYFIPSIPLAAAFALGAALGPTDAAAVTSLSKQIRIAERPRNILKGEMLLNDASGIVSFQFALGAVATGAFSLLEATGQFLLEFIGGLIAGAVLGYLGRWAIRKAREIGIENTTFHVLFEVFTPFLIYLISDAIHVSGIIAVVVGGLFNVISPNMAGPSISRMNIVSSSVWRVLTFALNGVVFVLLGTQLPNAMRHTWDDVSIGNGLLLLYILGLTALLLAIRFLWILCTDLVHVKRGEKRDFTSADAIQSLVATLCGVRGTVTLSILFTIPVFISYEPLIRFPQRDLIIFLACGVIVCTLLLANFVVPLISPKPKTEESELEAQRQDTEATIGILRNVIEELQAQQTAENRRETQVVIQSYNDRISRIKENNNIPEPLNLDLRLQAIRWEQERTFELMDNDTVPPLVGYRYLRRLERRQRLLKHRAGGPSMQNRFARLRALLRRGFRTVIHELPRSTLSAQAEAQRELQRDTTNYVIARLEPAVQDHSVPTEDASTLLLEYQLTRALLNKSRPTIASRLRVADRTDEIRRIGLNLELEQIQEFYEEDAISRATARRLRENVHLMQLDLEDNV